MEMKAYIEGIISKWWLIGLIVVLSFWIGGNIGNSQITQYTASTLIILNGPQLASSAIPSNEVQLSTPLTYESSVTSPAILSVITKHYPRLSRSALQRSIVVTADRGRRLLFISVTDIHPDSAADIANFLAQNFVKTQTSDLKRQLDYYESWLQHAIPSLTAEINKLNLEIQQLTPAPAPHSAPLPINSPTARTIANDQYKLDIDERNLYSYQQALNDIQNTRALFARAYVIMRPASAKDATIVPPLLSTPIIQLIGVLSGVIVVICLIVAMEYFTPFVRHKGELQRIAGLSVIAELPKLLGFEQKRLLQLRSPFLHWRVEALRLVCNLIGAPSVKDKGHMVLLTSPRKKCNFAPLLATFLALNGYQTLLIDADFESPGLHNKIKLGDPLNIATNKGLPLSFIKKSALPHLFVLPATAVLTQTERLTTNKLIELLPDLQTMFNIIIIDAPSLNHAVTHLLATKVAQTLLVVKKRRDSLNALKAAHVLFQELKLNATSLLLG